MVKRPQSLLKYDNQEVAERYNRRKGFDPLRKERMLAVTLDLLLALTPSQSVLLELGAGTGLFTAEIIKTKQFSKIHVTDGAPSMLAMAQQKFANEDELLQFDIIDFTTQWSDRFVNKKVDAVTSSMAIHHAENKQQLFEQVFDVLKPNGVFVFADHMAGVSSLGQYLIGRERALVVLGEQIKGNEVQIREQIELDDQRQAEEGNRCESVTQYLNYLSSVGFEGVDCLWHDYWLAVFVARKGSNT